MGWRRLIRELQALPLKRAAVAALGVVADILEASIDTHEWAETGIELDALGNRLVRCRRCGQEVVLSPEYPADEGGTAPWWPKGPAPTVPATKDLRDADISPDCCAAVIRRIMES